MAENKKPARIYPFKVRTVDAEASQRHTDMFKGLPSGLLSANHWGIKLVGTCTEEDLTTAYNSRLDPRDVWLVSPLKCGSIWSLEMIWLLVHDLDYDGAKAPLIMDRCTFTDWAFIQDEVWTKTFQEEIQEQRPDLLDGGNIKWMKEIVTSSPRIFKTHLPLSVNNPDLLDTCKVVFIVRNIKDVCLSYFKFSRLLRSWGFCGDLNEFADMFMAGQVLYTPVIPMIVEAWNLRYHPNMCILFYEDAKKDLPGYLKKMAGFLGKSYTDKEISKLADHLHIKNFRKNPDVNMEGSFAEVMYNKSEHGSFVRKGVVGDWYNNCTPELDAKFDKWLKKQLKGVDPELAKKL